MATFLYKTKGNADPKGKPRVYFTCHPDDFERYFAKIWEDISATHDVALYYTEDMKQMLDSEHLETDLGQMNLFVVPVTWKLLREPNRAMDEDVAYAKQENIPILPFMMEQGIDEFYAKPEKFGERQYLSPYASDMTAIRYEEKLKKYLESVLISDELAKRVRKAFDAYIFLSYRKKDRKYANELMKLIHKNPECRDVAIWYDEFLTPGESFADNIKKALEDSKLFALLVTPNLLEEPEGKPNFVMAKEYPAAIEAEKAILPAEMVQTDHEALENKFPGIPNCADPQDEERFKERLLHSLQRIAISANNNDPEHNFLIGLAYLEGIDVEVNRDRGVQLITLAAEAELLEAMNKLYMMYDQGEYVQLDYKKACVWAEKIATYCEKKYGERNPNTVNALGILASSYEKQGDSLKAAELQEKVYITQCEVHGENHPDTIIALNNAVCLCSERWHYQKVLDMMEKAHTQISAVYGESHPDALTMLHNLAAIYRSLGWYDKSLPFAEKAYNLQCNSLGEQHPDTLWTLNGLSSIYLHLGDYARALEAAQESYKLTCKALGENHPRTITMLGRLAEIYKTLGEKEKTLETYWKEYDLRYKVLGEEHPSTIRALGSLATANLDFGNDEMALKQYKQIYQSRSKIFGEDHLETVMSKKILRAIQKRLEEST